MPNEASAYMTLLEVLDEAEDKQGMEPCHCRYVSRQRDRALVGGAGVGPFSERLIQQAESTLLRDAGGLCVTLTVLRITREDAGCFVSVKTAVSCVKRCVHVGECAWCPDEREVAASILWMRPRDEFPRDMYGPTYT
jgi:hypothetical protein